MEHILTEESEHQAILVRALEIAPCGNRSGDRPFRYEEAWTRHENHEAIFMEAWEAAGTSELGLAACGSGWAV